MSDSTIPNTKYEFELNWIVMNGKGLESVNAQLPISLSLYKIN